MKKFFTPEILNGIDEDLIAASETAKKTATAARASVKAKLYILAAVIASFTLIAIATGILLYRKNLPSPLPSPSEETTSPQPDWQEDFVIENDVLLSYNGADSVVWIPEGVTTLSSQAFANAKSVRTICLSATVSLIEDDTFSNCENLEEVRVAKNGIIEERNAFIMSEDGSKILFVNTHKIKTECVLPEGVTQIANKAFQQNEQLQKVVLPQSMRTIGSQAFQGCINLTEIDLGGTRYIGSEAFMNCPSLKVLDLKEVYTVDKRAFLSCRIESIDFGSKLQRIGDEAFLNSLRVSEITLPATLIKIGSLAFPTDQITKIIFEGAPYQWENILKASPSFTNLDGIEVILLQENPKENPLRFISNGNGTCTVHPSERRLDEGVIVIPQISPTGDTVTAIASFEGCSLITEIVLPETVTELPDSAFKDCTSLQRIEMPSVQKLGKAAFANCESLQSITVPDGVTEILQSTFSNCFNLKEIILPSSITKIEGSFSYCKKLERLDLSHTSIPEIPSLCFLYCESLTEIKLPSTLKKIEMEAFRDTKKLKTIILPEGTEMLARAFTHSSLESIVIPDSVSNINFAFESCQSLKSVVVGKCVQYTRNAFYDCTALESVVLPDTLTAIEKYAFYGCSALREIRIPEQVAVIEKNAFQGCTSLVSVTIPNSVTLLGEEAFMGCSALESLILSNNLTVIPSKAFRDCTALKRLIVPEGVVEIDQYAFYNCSALTEVDLTDGLTDIDHSVFAMCKSLRSIALPQTLTALGGYTFGGCEALEEISISNIDKIPDGLLKGCTNLKKVQLPSNVTELGAQVFYQCTSLEAVNIPDTVTYIGKECFFECKSLTFSTLPGNLQTIEDGVFQKCNFSGSLRIPAQISWIGKTSFAFCTGIKTLILEGGGLLYTGYNSFSSCHELELIIIENGIDFTGNSGAFSSNRLLEEVRILNGTVTLPALAFSGCTLLKTIDFSKLNNIPDRAFAWCSALEEVVISDEVTKLGAYAFKGCTGLKKITLSESLTSIDFNCFEGCTALKEITLPKSLRKIGYQAFLNCTALDEITIPQGTQDLEYAAFSGCTNLKTIYYTGSEADWFGQHHWNESTPLFVNNVVFLNSVVYPNGFRADGTVVELVKGKNIELIRLDSNFKPTSDPAISVYISDNFYDIYPVYRYAYSDTHSIICYKNDYYLVANSDIAGPVTVSPVPWPLF